MPQTLLNEADFPVRPADNRDIVFLERVKIVASACSRTSELSGVIFPFWKAGLRHHGFMIYQGDGMDEEVLMSFESWAPRDQPRSNI